MSNLEHLDSGHSGLLARRAHSRLGGTRPASFAAMPPRRRTLRLMEQMFQTGVDRGRTCWGARHVPAEEVRRVEGDGCGSTGV